LTSEDAVRVTTVVPLDPATAFAVFTEEVDAWWRRGPRYRFGPGRDGTMRFEPGVGGRLLEVDETAGDTVEVGRVRAWEPGRRLAFGFRGRAFAAGEETLVEVRFERVAAGTRVTLEHRGWEALRPGHPARRGLTGGAFTSMIGLWWGDQLTALRARAAAARGARGT
jgi:hypothetical protein